MQTKIFEIDDLEEENKTWECPRQQISITSEDRSFFKYQLKEEFKIHLKFPQGKIIDKKGNKYYDGFFNTNIVNNIEKRFGKGRYAICTVWKNSKQRDGILQKWFKEYNLTSKNKIKISENDDKYYLEPFKEITK